MKHQEDKPLLKIIDILIVNFFWFLFSIPVFTFGAATSAAHYVIIKIVSNKEVNPVKMFIKGFKDDFKQGIIMSFVTAVSCGIAFAIWYAMKEFDEYNFILVILASIFTITVLNTNIFMYSFIARYENTFGNMVKNVIIRELQFYKRGFLVFICVLLELLIVVFIFNVNIYAGIISLFFWPGMIIYTVCICMKEVYRQIEEN